LIYRRHLWKRRKLVVHQGFLTTMAAFVAWFCPSSVAQENDLSNTPKQIVTVQVNAVHPIKSFDPDVALGTSIDILPQGVVDKIYTPEILKESLSAGWGPITYRQNTEL